MTRRLSPLELRLERVKNVCRARDELLKRQDDRLPIFERYCGGAISIHMHIDFGAIGQFCALYLSTTDSSEGTDSATLPVDVSHKRCCYYGPLLVLVGIRDIPELTQPGKRLSTEVRSSGWLAPLDCCDLFVRESFKVGAVNDMSAPTVFIVLDRKLSTKLLDPSTEERQVENEVIERGAKIVDGFSHEHAEHGWQSWEIYRGVSNQLVRLKLETEGNLLLVGIPEDLAPTFDVRQVFSCPRYPKIGGHEKWIVPFGGQGASL